MAAQGFPSASRFGVEVDGVAVEGWQRIDLPAVSAGGVTDPGGDGAQTANERTDRSSRTLLEMERGVTPGDDGYVWNWVEDLRRGNAETSRRDILVTLEDADGNPLTRWEFRGCRPTDYEPPDLDAAAAANGPTERLTVVVSEYATRDVERICGHDLERITRAYSRSTGTLPEPLRGLVTDATIHGVVAGDDDGDYTIRTGPDGEITTVLDREPSTPDVVVETDCETLTGVVTADDPRARLRSAYEDGDVRVRGTGLISGIVTGIAHTVTRIADVLS
jgi:phage tail-like protein